MARDGHAPLLNKSRQCVFKRTESHRAATAPPAGPALRVDFRNIKIKQLP
jgi:hypothetical protein